MSTSTPSRLACVALTAVACLAAPAAQAVGITETKHPVVLVHGFIGFSSILGIQYFYQIPDALKSGGTKVYIAQVNPSQTTEYRGEQLLQQMKQWAAKDGVTKFNLIGHSHGGPTSRYVAGVAPAMVASVTTVAGTNYGSVVADKIGANTNDGSAFEVTATAGLQLINWLSGGSSQSIKDTDLKKALTTLSTEAATAFNARFPEGASSVMGGNGVRYYSASGNKVKTNGWDISDAILAYTGSYFGSEPNDGLVSQSSSRWGQVLRDDYPWNHLDEINQIFGTIGSGAPDPKAFYQMQVTRLRLLGL